MFMSHLNQHAHTKQANVAIVPETEVESKPKRDGSESALTESKIEPRPVAVIAEGPAVTETEVESKPKRDGSESALAESEIEPRPVAVIAEGPAVTEAEVESKQEKDVGQVTENRVEPRPAAVTVDGPAITEVDSKPGGDVSEIKVASRPVVSIGEVEETPDVTDGTDKDGSNSENKATPTKT